MKQATLLLFIITYVNSFTYLPRTKEKNVSNEEFASLVTSSSTAPPPSSFYQLNIAAQEAATLAIARGERLLEVEFPPLPSEVLEMDDVSAYDVAKANLRLSIDFAKVFAQRGEKVAILFPDEAESKIAIDNYGTDKPFPGVSISSLRQSDPDDDRLFKPEQIFLSLIGGSAGQVKAIEGVDMYIVIVASAQELPDIEELHLQSPTSPIVFFNMKLDTLRGDLGIPAFPPKDLQDRFLSRVRPTYYLRTRQYSRTKAEPPFVVNYQGCLFRQYPGEYQTLLDIGDGNFRRVKSSGVRPGLGEFKEQLVQALMDKGVVEREGDTLKFLRTGYKTQTWWEEERENAADNFRT
ncbi:hypothetical protein TrCOL_g908 [Triparma columacea]|uniref:DUF1995 domain-containing protein n=1 Tax=Triparma columacea TaxID=722753 RepID=A0A9W7LEI1_9STRA|nr:hypothetical protein TrCOL_g908 [Triparma columacea]